ncbi:glycosyltransferase [Vibrio sinensis]|uniref:Glycosyltransferase n=1 Tax=Vibrio sinensis TaxID=2302434 RepID=A0A3A6QNF3_9VIBR|nr:glycosyltransferase family 2 protein [Vibrio sinensis]RJX69711.1 glycosyltransferase [Vibrio sinensis]
MNYKYSVVVPHYNNPNGLDRLLASIPQREDIQVLIVDDNSRNPLEEQCFIDKYSGLAIRFFNNDSGNKGAGAARNIALKYMDSEYTLFADADDFFIENAFYILDDMISFDDITYFSPKSQCDITGEASDRHHLYENLVNQHIALGDEELRYHFLVPWSKVFSTHFIKQHGLYFDSVIASNDVMFSMVSGHSAKSIKVSKQSIYCVTRGKGTLTVNFNPEVTQARFNVEKRRLEYIAKNNIKTETNSVYKLIKLYRKILTLEDYKHIFNTLLNGHITMLPKRTSFYLKNPKELLVKIISRKESLTDEKYRA